MVSILIVVTIVYILPTIRGMILYICLFLLIFALILMFYSNSSLIVWIESMKINLTLVSIFIVVPLLGIPVKVGEYVESLKILLSNHLNKPFYFYLGTNILTHILSVVINIGSISIAQELSRSSDIKNNQLMANSINRGYIMAIFWSPYFSSMALILAYLPISWSSLLQYSFGMVLLTIGISLIFDFNRIKKSKIKNESKELYTADELKSAKKKVVELICYLVLITGIILIAETLIKSASMVFLITIASFILPLIWVLIFRKFNEYKLNFKNHLYFGLPRMSKEIVLFLIAGFFSGAFIEANLGNMFMELIQSVFGSFYIGAAYMIIFIIFFAGLIGVHPIVFITVFVTSIIPETIGFSPEYFALLLLFSFGVSNTISPSTAVNNILSNLLDEPLVNVSLRWNFKFAITLIMIIPLYLYIVKV